MKKLTLFLVIGVLFCSCVTVERAEIGEEEVVSLEERLISLGQENELLRKELAQTQKELQALRERPSRVELTMPSVPQIQTALRNAGFFRGKIDGVIGVETKIAIMAFQKSEKLKADGVVGSKTWEKLRDYLN